MHPDASLQLLDTAGSTRRTIVSWVRGGVVIRAATVQQPVSRPPGIVGGELYAELHARR